MCDSFVALGGSTLSGHAIYAKNSDRERNEAQFLEIVAGAEHPVGAITRATYITLPQVRRTATVLLSRPFWTWGAEMGTNEHSVVIGNQAMHSHIPAIRRPALIGMDLVRLGLERSDSAASALNVIISLLEQHGQGGNCGLHGRLYYHNGFIIADRSEAYVLETIGKWWIVEKIASSRSLSNAFSIGTTFSAISPALRDHAVASRWRGDDGEIDYAARLIDPTRDAITFGTGRCARGAELLDRHDGSLTAALMISILRDHGASSDANPHWHPTDDKGRTICMHAGAALRKGQTTGSLVAELRNEAILHWVTGTSAPCTGIFKPVVLADGFPEQGGAPRGTYDPHTLWWRHERFHRTVLRDFANRLDMIRDERDSVEKRFRESIDTAWRVAGPDSDQLRQAVRECWREAADVEARWASAVAISDRPTKQKTPYDLSWARHNSIARLPRMSGTEARRISPRSHAEEDNRLRRP